MSKVIIAGSRSLAPTAAQIDEIVRKSGFHVELLVSGGAVGVDLAGEAWAKARGIPCKRFLPDYSKGAGTRAPLDRNIAMAEFSDSLISIWDGNSTGTQHMVTQMKKRNKPFFEVKLR